MTVERQISSPQIIGYRSVKEEADFRRVATSTVLRWDRNGLIPASVKIGGRRLFPVYGNVGSSSSYQAPQQSASEPAVPVVFPSDGK